MKTRISALHPLARILIATGIILGAMTALAAPAWQGHEDYEDGILTVFNPATPINQESVVKPTPQWRIGGEDGEAEILFGLITDAQRKADGTTYLLDAVLSTVYKIGAKGEVLQTMGHEGDGPGEFRNSTSLALLPDNCVGVVEMMPSRMVVLDAGGPPRPSIELGDGEGGRSHVQRVTVADDLMVMGLMSMKFSEGKAEISQILGTFNLDGSLRHKLMHTSETQSGGSVSISSGGDDDFANNWVLGAGGQIAIYRHSNEYLVELFGTDGTPTRRIRREYKSMRRSEEDIQAQRDQREELRQRFGTTMEMGIEEIANDISNVIARPNGDWWVLSSEGLQNCPVGYIGSFDVYDAKGRFVRQTRIKADFNDEDDQFLIRGNHLYVLKEANNAPDRVMSGGGGNRMMIMTSSGSNNDEEDDDEEPQPYEVICYELPPGI